LAQRLINGITAPTGEGRLFEVDMRLRPSGNQGAIASSVEGFRRYQLESAWTWEHMSLTRARVITGAPALARRLEAVLANLARPRDRKLAAEVLDMRGRIAQQFPGDHFWDIKYRRGGMLDVEFIAQYLQLRDAAADPGVLHQNTAEAFRRLAAAGSLAPAVAEALIAAGRLWHCLLGMLRLTIGAKLDEAMLSDGLGRTLATAAGVGDVARLRSQVEDTAERVATHFERLIGPAIDLTSLLRFGCCRVSGAETDLKQKTAMSRQVCAASQTGLRSQLHSPVTRLDQFPAKGCRCRAVTKSGLRGLSWQPPSSRIPALRSIASASPPCCGGPPANGWHSLSARRPCIAASSTTS
jgi:glutamine synthetase adenylyltransferase